MNAQQAEPAPKSKTKIAFSEYTPRTHSNASLDDATEEIRREISVRKRLYDRWYAKGDMTWSEGDGRMRGLMTALTILNKLPADAVETMMAAEQEDPI